MRKLLHMTVALSALLATSMAANAADVGARPSPFAPPPPVYAPPPFTWTGFYLGGNNRAYALDRSMAREAFGTGPGDRVANTPTGECVCGEVAGPLVARHKTADTTL